MSSCLENSTVSLKMIGATRSNPLIDVTTCGVANGDAVLGRDVHEMPALDVKYNWSSSDVMQKFSAYGMFPNAACDGVPNAAPGAARDATNNLPLAFQ